MKRCPTDAMLWYENIFLCLPVLSLLACARGWISAATFVSFQGGVTRSGIANKSIKSRSSILGFTTRTCPSGPFDASPAVGSSVFSLLLMSESSNLFSDFPDDIESMEENNESEISSHSNEDMNDNQRTDGSSSSSSSSIVIEEEAGEIVEPGKMRISEIKAELELRNVQYDDCFDKESLTERLLQSRRQGKSNPTIIDQFNQQKLEEILYPEKKMSLWQNNDDDDDTDDDTIFANAVANDGTLPGGLTPDQFKQLASNDEVMELLQSTKMQEAMKLMMTSGPEELERQLRKDPELQKVVEKLTAVLGEMNR
jgi:hypothetical protein